MPFSKYEPHRPPEEVAGDGLDASTPSAGRRARVLRWANRIVLVYTALGFGLIAYWLLR